MTHGHQCVIGIKQVCIWHAQFEDVDVQDLVDDWIDPAASEASSTSDNEDSSAMGIEGSSAVDVQAASFTGDHNEEISAQGDISSISLASSSLQARNDGELMSHPITPTYLSNNDPNDDESMDVFVSANSVSEESSPDGEAWNDAQNGYLAGGQHQFEEGNQDGLVADPIDVNNENLNDPFVPASIPQQENANRYMLYNLETPGGLRTYWTLGSMARREMMDIKFHNPVVGNCVCLLINTCENLMVELEDSHEGPNVDVNFVWMLGETVTVLD